MRTFIDCARLIYLHFSFMALSNVVRKSTVGQCMKTIRWTILQVREWKLHIFVLEMYYLDFYYICVYAFGTIEFDQQIFALLSRSDNNNLIRSVVAGKCFSKTYKIPSPLSMHAQKTKKIQQSAALQYQIMLNN